MLVFFFFQAEDGIRDADVTGVQTCALPISKALGMPTDAFLRIILLLNPIIGKSLVRVFGLAKLYDALPRETALRLVASLRSARAGNGPALVCRKAPKEAPEADCALDCLAQRHR